jgi:hypothetical protein
MTTLITLKSLIPESSCLILCVENDATKAYSRCERTSAAGKVGNEHGVGWSSMDQGPYSASLGPRGHSTQEVM